MIYHPKAIQKQTLAPQRPSAKIERPQSSIVVNLKSISELSAQEHTSRAQTQSIAQNFTPLSITPITTPPLSSTPQAHSTSDDQVREIKRPSMRELELEQTGHYEAVDFQSHKGLKLILAGTVLLAVWAVGVSAQVGASAFFSSPLSATRMVLNPSQPQVTTREKREVEEFVEQGTLEVTASASLYTNKGRWVIVEGEVSNQTSSPRSSISINLTLTFQGSAPRQEELTCCDAPLLEQGEEAREAWLEQALTERSTGSPQSPQAPQAPQGSGDTTLASGESARFMRLFKLPPRVKEAPEVSARIRFYE